jgi:tetratricopeptide (TPR) repeat protein
MPTCSREKSQLMPRLPYSMPRFSSRRTEVGKGLPLRAWYLGGDKEKGQRILDAVTGHKQVADSDWFRVGRIYAEAGEWNRAQRAFDRALSMNPGDDSGLIEYGALANVNGDRAKAEALFEKALKRNPREFWHWVNAGASYLGVRPE